MTNFDSDWIDCMSEVEPNLLEVNIRSRSFLSSDEIKSSKGDNKWQVSHKDPAWTSSKLVLETKNPFSRMNIQDTDVLDSLQERQPCDLCHKSRKFFCYSCHVPLPTIKHVLPKVNLPVQIDIVKHPGEVEGKSTAVHAKLLARDHVNIHIWPDIPDYTKEQAVLVFPGKESKSMEYYRSSSLSNCDNVFPFTKIVFIDSTWNQCHKICQDSRIHSLPQIMIKSRQTLFWRYQSGKPKEYLSTIEAIYYLCVDFDNILLGNTYCGQYDNLLFFFKFMYEKIHQLYTNY